MFTHLAPKLNKLFISATKKIALILVILLPVSCPLGGMAFASSQMFTGAPQYRDLDPSIQHSVIFKGAPRSKIAEISYQSRELSGYKKYSNYQIRRYKNIHGFTEYRTTEWTGAASQSRLYGFGIGYGGILSLAYMKRGNLARHSGYFIHHQWMKISDVKGDLFPLKVGNRLTFHYEDLMRHRQGERAKPNSGKIVYQVLRKMKGYNSGFTTIPGDVYVISYSKTTRNHPRLMTQNIYYFSKRLGWYVYAKYYFAGRAEVEYRVKQVSMIN